MEYLFIFNGDMTVKVCPMCGQKYLCPLPKICNTCGTKEK